ncbi:MAG: antitoxin [Candidatus Portnoybacteria bacterium RIFCSPLOWO2_01_FULL_43_11]|uniref:Antitoxin n=4 Tax=Candidatus Portnoyibacteriota TaxID=1817913 RepID=A0A1G2FBR8_9BACT|nr:MAG: antitoxin [Candidatus Portnoybacteria bacterium RIFCSPHIGHO2_01_FULL_40_12b]OGZ37052.1 MAG: antitoxin [Candidatus Portnoybacteria bacterium RIFCSPHIGHO2_02_FULL_40_23]OGZ38870.1 MAG: antitoxin [Candidatus Portnoybacteria bacterium RIFCSPLOWO2_01_FULL_43_11]OGZ39458.1 MAG: antitoxin [Candidatus Portnoybacteria bacterium RIFCSPHIGHO2_12_FULL_40_11]OGZ40516.1 MAG: antitoxin [Candidatus Portnoybacteria bacterium RIFCSPLOWO2_02_FULL_40_15]
MNRITYNKKIFGGKPIIKGTRISVEFILELLASGMTVEEIVEEYPRLKKADVLAAIDYAAKTVKREELVFA